jgi:regulator of sirC expression with transglutaminase-like and TPR domain
VDETTEQRNAHLTALACLGRMHPSAVPLDRGAALIAAHEQPWLDPADLVARLDDLAAGLHVPEGCSPIEQVARINLHVFDTLGFSGAEEDYDAPVNSMLDRVIEQRKGLPILVSLIYVEIARRAGVAMDGVGVPGHFVVRPRGIEDVFFVDPFSCGKIWRPDEMLMRLRKVTDTEGGRLADPEGCLEPTLALEIVARVSRNLKVSYLRRGDASGALRAVDRLLALSPSQPEERRDRGLLLLELDRRDEALHDLQRYLTDHPGGDDWNMISQLADQLGQTN